MIAALFMSAWIGGCAVRASGDPHLRADQPQARSTIEMGCAGSATFRWLSDELDRSDVVVYVRLESSNGFHPAGRVNWLAHAGGRRYLVITIDRALSAVARAAVLGHELQHAVEIARAPVVDSQTLVALYERIGIVDRSKRAQRHYDSAGAVEAGRRVLRELSALDAE